jgi:purine-binding chemotaxis protein CheW
VTIGNERQVAIFQVGEEKFALDIMQIGLIERWQKPRRIPRAPSFLEGVVDMRGEKIVPLVNLYERLGLPSSQPDEDKRRILIARIDGLEVGFVVDAVLDVTTIPEASVEQPPAVGSAPRFLEGLVRRPDGILLLIDMAHILTGEEKLHIEELRRALTVAEATSVEEAAVAASRGPRKGKGKRS